MAIGQSDDGDLNVLTADANTAGAAVRVRSYRDGAPSDVAAQRWTFEVVTAGAQPVYRIKHVASGLCMQKSMADGNIDGAKVVLAVCRNSNEQRWRSGDARTFPNGGFELRSVRDGRCLDLYTSSEGAPAIVWSCDGITTQMWRVRIGGFDCPDRIVIGVCVSTSEAMFGVMSAWRQHPFSFAAPASPDDGGDFNTVSSMVSWNPLDTSGGDPGFDSIEMGWRAQFESAVPLTSHQAYWSEIGTVNEQTVEEFHGIEQPDSRLANGQTHTWMSLGREDGQWDVLYDFNYVGTTRMASGSRTRAVESAVLPQYEELVSFTPFEKRVQLLDGNQVWRRPALTELAGFPANICGLPDPWTIEMARRNTPPWCFTSGIKTRTVQSGPAELEYHTVGKPESETTVTSPVQPALSGSAKPTLSSVNWIHNGVDQRRLSVCLASDPTKCLDSVPGLRDCVRARTSCNVINQARQALRGPGERMITLQQAVISARSTLRGRSSSVARPAGVGTLTVAELRDRSPIALLGIGNEEKVHVVTGHQSVAGLTSRGGEYRGYTLIYLASGGQLVYAGLGPQDFRKDLV